MNPRSDDSRDVTALLDELIATLANLLDGEPLGDVEDAA